MIRTNGIWRATITVPTGATRLDFRFHNQSGTWNNNGGSDYYLDTVTTGTPIPVPTPTLTAFCLTV